MKTRPNGGSLVLFLTQQAIHGSKAIRQRAGGRPDQVAATAGLRLRERKRS